MSELTQFFSFNTSFLLRERCRSVIQVLLGSCFIAFCAQIRLTLGFTPIPLSGQTLAVMLVGAALGPRQGALSAIAYLVQGAMGAPVFAGGMAGLAYLLGPTGGYLLAFPFEAAMFGWLAEKKRNTPVLCLGAIMACTVQLVAGAGWLALFTGFNQMLALGVYPFILIELFKASFVCQLLKRKHG